MTCNRFFMFGIVLLLMGIHFRVVDSLVLNERTSHFVEKRIVSRKKAMDPLTSLPVSLDSTDEWWYGNGAGRPDARLMTVTPPNWLGWSLVSVGAVLILTCPCFRF